MRDVEQEWPLVDRVRNAFTILEVFDRYRNDPMFQPSPVHVAFALSAAREALDKIVSRGVTNTSQSQSGNS